MKNWINSRTQIMFNLILVASLALAFPAQIVAQQKNQAPAMPDLSPQQMEELQAELAKINEEMQAFVKTLPPEKQQEIAELEEAINQMSDEELEGLFEQLFTDPNFLNELEQMTGQPQQPSPAEPEPVYEPIAQPVFKPIEKPRVEKNRITMAAEMIKSLSNTTETFLAKLDTVPEIDDVVQNWIKKHQLRGWKQNIAWDAIKSQIDLFNQKLQKLLQREPGSNEYRFLPDLVDAESVYNNLAHMENVLKLNVPKIEVAVFGLKKLSKDSKTAMRAVLNKYSEGMSELQLIPSLNSIIEKHEPIAKQMREKEELLSKNAFEESKKLRTEKTMVIAGKPEPRPSAPSKDYSDYDYYPSSGYNPSYVPNYSPISSPEQSGFSEKQISGSSEGAGKNSAAGNSKGSDKGGKKDAGKEKDAASKGAKETKDKESKENKKPKSSLEGKLETAQKKLKAANDASGDPLLLYMSKNVSIPGQAPKQLSSVIQGSLSKINDATAAVNDLAKSLTDEPEKTKKEYKGKVKNSFNKQFNLAAVDNQLQGIKKNWHRTKDSMNEARLQAYGLNFDAPKSSDSVKTKMDAELQNDEKALEEILKEIELQDQNAGFAPAAPAPAAAKKPVSQPAKGAPAKAAVAPAAKTEAEIQAEFEKYLKEREKPTTPQTIYDALEALKQAIEKLAK